VSPKGEETITFHVSFTLFLENFISAWKDKIENEEKYPLFVLSNKTNGKE